MKFQLLTIAVLVAAAAACRDYERARDHTGAEIFCEPHVGTGHACPSNTFCGQDNFCCDRSRPITTTTTRRTTTRTSNPATTTNPTCRTSRVVDHTGEEIYCLRDGHACPSDSFCAADGFCCSGAAPAPTTTTTTRRTTTTTRRSCPYGYARDHTGARVYCEPHVGSGHACPSGSTCGDEFWCCNDAAVPTTRGPTTTTRRSTTTTARFGCRRGVARDHTGASIYCARDGHACTASSFCGPEDMCCNY